MGGELERVLERAAKDPRFLALLLEDRERAIASLDVSDAVKQVLRSADIAHLTKLADQMRRRLAKPKRRRLRPGVVAASGLAAAATIGAISMPNLVGLDRETIGEERARHWMDEVAAGLVTYHHHYGRYGTLDELVADGLVSPRVLADEYEVAIVSEGDAFRLIARHRSRPDTRATFEWTSRNGVREVPRDVERPRLVPPGSRAGGDE